MNARLICTHVRLIIGIRRFIGIFHVSKYAGASATTAGHAKRRKNAHFISRRAIDASVKEIELVKSLDGVTEKKGFSFLSFCEYIRRTIVMRAY